MPIFGHRQPSGAYLSGPEGYTQVHGAAGTQEKVHVCAGGGAGGREICVKCVGGVTQRRVSHCRRGVVQIQGPMPSLVIERSHQRVIHHHIKLHPLVAKLLTLGSPPCDWS